METTFLEEEMSAVAIEERPNPISLDSGEEFSLEHLLEVRNLVASAELMKDRRAS